MSLPTVKAGRAALLLGILAVWLLRRRRRSQAPAERHAGAQTETLRYRVPVGQDPAGVVATLRQAGYRVVRDQRPTHIQELLITAAPDSELDRDAVRDAIEQAPLDIEGAPAPPHAVVFTDEPGSSASGGGLA